jgi:hypothetical protein
MSNASISSLTSLPVEILHRIFDSLDASIIVLSLRCTCRRLKAVVNNYERYTLDFRSCSKSDFQLLCRLIDPRKVVSLILSPTEERLNQIELLISSFRIRQFSRIRSLTLNEIEERQLKGILKRFHIPSLTSFSLKIEKTDDRCKNTTAALLLSITSQVNLHRLHLETCFYRRRQIIWPVQCMVRYLKIGHCGDSNQIVTILRCSPNLQTFIVIFADFANDTIASVNTLPIPFQQLTSLTLENLRTKIDNLELLLSMMTSLTYLKLIGYGQYMDGNRWEQFIQTNLPFLDKFELFVQEPKDATFTFSGIESVLSPFQTSFWLEHKKWFFFCEFDVIYPHKLKLYSVPVCVSSFTYEPDSRKLSLSTVNSTINHNVSMMDNVNTICLTIPNFSLNDIQQMMEVSFNNSFL